MSKILVIPLLILSLFSHGSAYAKKEKFKKPKHMWYQLGIPNAGKGTIIYEAEAMTPARNKNQALYQNNKYAAKREKFKKKKKEIPEKYRAISLDHPTMKKKTVSIWVKPTSDKVLPEAGDFGKKINKKTGEEVGFWGDEEDLALDFALGATVGILGLPVTIARDLVKYKRVHDTGYPSQELQSGIIVTKDKDGDYVKVCDPLSSVASNPTRDFYEKFSAFDLDRYDDYTKDRKFSILEFEPECFTTKDKRILVLYTHAKSSRGGFRFAKTTIAKELKEIIAEDFGLEFKEKSKK